MYRKILAIIEFIMILGIFFVQILPHWTNKYTTPGDLTSLEIIALLMWNAYENLKNKVQ